MDARAVELKRLIAILQLAYSGELAACHAYRGHALSVRDPEEKRRIRQIEDEEWEHRRCVGGLLAALGAGPDPARERTMLRVGRAIAFLCRIGGWFVPMYGAGRLERGNVKEYEDAADFAEGAGRPELVEDLLKMAEVEWEHEKYFREKTESHFLSRVVPVWAPPPPKESIRARRGSLAVPSVLLTS